MPFVALDPPAKSIAGTGVKLTVSPGEIAIPTDSVTVVRGQPSTSHSTPRTASVTLPATGNGRTRSA